MQELEILNKKIEALLQKYTALLAENKSLKENLEASQTKEAAHTARIGELEARLREEVSASQAGTEHIKKQVDTAISEIDRILSVVDEH